MLFEKKEYKERLKKVKIDMQKKGIDLLVSHDPSNMNYLTGYDAWSFYYAQCVLVHVNEEEPICFVRAQDGGGAYIKTYLKDENIIEYDEKYIHTWPLHPYQYLTEIIKKRKWDNLNIGLEMDSHYFTAFCYETIKKGLPNAKLKDAERLVNWVRVVKSNAEIKLMQSAARIVESGMKTAFKSINPGVRQCDAVAEIQKALFNGTKEFVEGIPNFVISVGLVENNEPILGIIYNPVTDQMFYAYTGSGVKLNGANYAISKMSQLSKMSMLNSRSETKAGLWEPYKKHFNEVSPIGSIAYKLALVSTAQSDMVASLT